MSLQQIDLTTALRPALLPDEVLLFVQDSVGLYEGKFKIPEFQNGQAYLTSHRACYIDNEDPRNRACAIYLKDVERSEFYAGFLKSSPKVILYPKASKRALSSSWSSVSPKLDVGASSTLNPRTNGSPLRPSIGPAASRPNTNATWICPICSFSNPVPSNFDPASANATTPLPTCHACGMKPPLINMVKAALASIQTSQSSNTPSSWSESINTSNSVETLFQCPRCTFGNDPSLLTCEMCGGPLNVNLDRYPAHTSERFDRSESPGPLLSAAPHGANSGDSIKFSFHGGGEKIFLERLKGALVQRKWLLQSAPPVPRDDQSFSVSGSGTYGSKDAAAVGIAGLEQRGMTMRKNNEMVIGNAFEDLEALMSSAKEIIDLAEQFASQTKSDGAGQSSDTSNILSQSASALNLFTTKDMLHTGAGSESLYVSELSRNLAEFLTDDATGVLKNEGGIISLVDLWAVFNRARGGVELVSPTDFKQAADLWSKLKLPVRLRTFKSGLLVVQATDRTDEKIVASLLAWLGELRKSGQPSYGLDTDATNFGRGVTALEAAEKFGWSVGVAAEELAMAEERGALCRDVGIEGVTFWENWLVQDVGLESGMARLQLNPESK